MNKILVVVSFVFVSFLSCTGLTDRQRLANQILSDTNLLKVDSMARATIRNGFNAGSGYSQIWARDMNTFIEIACEESDPHELREAILLFFALQQPNDEMIDGYVLKGDFTWYDDTPYYSNAAPKHVAFKNTVETDQESSLIQIVGKYIRKTGDREILNEKVAGKTVLERMNAMVDYLMRERYNEKSHIYPEKSPIPEGFDELAIHYHGGTAIAIEAGLLSKDEIRTVNAQMLENVRLSGMPSIGLTLYPVYPDGFFHGGMSKAYLYQNGGDWTWFGGRMIQQLVVNGMVEEAYAEIHPMIERVIQNDGFYEWYGKGGVPSGSGNFKGSAGVLSKAIELLRDWAEKNKS